MYLSETASGGVFIETNDEAAETLTFFLEDFPPESNAIITICMKEGEVEHVLKVSGNLIDLLTTLKQIVEQKKVPE